MPIKKTKSISSSSEPNEDLSRKLRNEEEKRRKADVVKKQEEEEKKKFDEEREEDQNKKKGDKKKNSKIAKEADKNLESKNDVHGSESNLRSKLEKTAVKVVEVSGAITALAGAIGAAMVIGVQAAGFTSSGVAGGSIAAGMMSSATKVEEGKLAAGSTVAILQSFGAKASIVGPIILVLGGGALLIGGLLYRKYKQHKN